MASAGLMANSQTTLQPPGKRYNRTKLAIGILSTILSFVVLLILVAEGYSKGFALWAGTIASQSYLALLLFSLAVGLSQTVITLPLSFYSGYIIEHRYGLSNQSLWRWAGERLKGLLVAAPIGAAVLIVLYYCLNRYGSAWWLPVSIALTVFSVVLARLAPVLIMPLFYKFTPLADGSLKERIMRLCAEAGLRVEGVFSFNLSKNTKKANAGFTGIGKSRRIILGDTLVKEFSEEEIETVFAHELGHYKHRHIIIGICIGTVSTFAGLFIAARLYEASLSVFGFSSITELAALPLLAIWLSVFALVTSPLGNIISRRHERQADAYAVKSTGNRSAFVSALRKLAAMNLADPEPHPLVEFLFYSHPAIARRIKIVESLGT
jgi:STE24 endopeptidase